MRLLKKTNVKLNLKEVYRKPEIGSGLVRISHKISSISSKPQIVKIGEKYYKVRELG